MSSYSALESSEEASRPIEIYEIVLGTTVYRYTSAEDDITVGSNVYLSESISRNSVALGSDDRTRVMEIKMPASNEFASQYIGIVPGQRASISIIRLQRDESPPFSTQTLLFKGFVQSVRFPGKGFTAVIGAKSIEASASRPIPRVTFQGLCNHVLYDSHCGISPASYRIIGTVTSVSGNIITVSGASSKADGYFTSGYIKPASLNDFRLILAHNGDNLTVLLPFPVDITGMDVEVYAGCDHKINGDCKNKFNNVINYGGFAWVPTKNPFESGLI